MEKRRDIEILGIDIGKRDRTAIPVKLFNGRTVPYPDNSFDCVLFIDVLHHTSSPLDLLKEAVRVCRKNIIIKDHFADTFFDRLILKFMDWIGNRPHGVNLTYNYWSSEKWRQTFKQLNLQVENEIRELHLYPFPFSLIFGRSKHLIVKGRSLSSASLSTKDQRL